MKYFPFVLLTALVVTVIFALSVIIGDKVCTKTFSKDFMQTQTYQDMHCER